MDFVGTVWALLPPVIAIVLALITKEVYMSLFIGVVTGALLYTNFSPVGTIEAIFEVMMEKLGDSWNVGILIFLVFLGIIVALMTRAGGSAAYGKWAGNKIKTRSGAFHICARCRDLCRRLFQLSDRWKCHASCHRQAEDFPCKTGLYH